MEAAVRTTFGPYYVQNVIAASEIAELSLAMLFVPDGTKPVIALRRIRNENIDKEKFDQEFLEHAARYAVLRHPNIAEVKDLGTLEDRCYIATEHVRGKSLLSALAACGRMGLGFPTDIALYIVSKMLE